MTEFSYKFETTVGLKQKIAEIELIPLENKERKTAFIYMILEDSEEFCFTSETIFAIYDYFEGGETAVIPKELRERLRHFLSALPPMLCFKILQTLDIPTIGKKVCLFEEFEICGQFLDEQDVVQLHELSSFIPELKNKLEELQMAPSAPLPTNFFARWLESSKRSSLLKNIDLMTEYIYFVDTWTEILSQAIQMKKGLFVYR